MENYMILVWKTSVLLIAISLKFVSRFNTVYIIIPVIFFNNLTYWSQNLYEISKHLEYKNNFEKKKVGGLMLCDFKINYEAILSRPYGFDGRVDT